MRRLLAFGLPLFFIIVIAIGLLAISYQLSLPVATPTAISPTSAPTMSGTLLPASTPIVVPASTSNQSPAPRDFFKDVSLVFASGLITLSGYFISAYIQSAEKDKEEMREQRRKRTKAYRDYLHWLLSIGQHSMIVVSNSVLKKTLPNDGAKFIIDKEKLEEVVEKLPPAWELSELRDDNNTKQALDDAISSGIRFITDLYSGQKPDYATISSAYQSAIDALDRYEKFG